VRIPDDAVKVDPGSGVARYRVTNLDMPDYFDIPNALFRFEDPVSVASTVSFDVRFRGPVAKRSVVRNADQGFAGTFVLNEATMTWSATSDDGFSFVSDPSPTTSAFSMVGHERNGRFL